MMLWLAAVLWLCGFIFLWRVPDCRQGAPAAAYPRVSVVIPARDEERNLPALLSSLATQALRPFEIIVVDDHSRDRTAETARRGGAVVIPARDLPPGWLGKPWACQQGADQAAGEVLVFLDADISLEPGGLRRILDTFLSGPGVLSISPYHQAKTWVEQFSAFFNLMQAAGLNAFTIFGSRVKPAGLFGPCLVIRKADYLRAGGHAAVKDQILENYALAGPLARAGLPLRLYGGRYAVNVRLYPNGWRELIQGWSKSFAKGAGKTPGRVLALVIAWISGMILTSVFLLYAAWLHAGWQIAAWAAAYAAYALQLHWHLRRLGAFRWSTAWLFPLFLIFFLGIFSWSAFLTRVKKKVTWRGRVIRDGK